MGKTRLAEINELFAQTTAAKGGGRLSVCSSVIVVVLRLFSKGRRKSLFIQMLMNLARSARKEKELRELEFFKYNQPYFKERSYFMIYFSPCVRTYGSRPLGYLSQRANCYKADGQFLPISKYNGEAFLNPRSVL